MLIDGTRARAAAVAAGPRAGGAGPVRWSARRWGLVTGDTGMFVIPAVPCPGSLELERDDLVLALGLSFTVSTLALGRRTPGRTARAAARSPSTQTKGDHVPSPLSLDAAGQRRGASPETPVACSNAARDSK